MQDTANKLSKTSIFLHWLVGITIIGLLALGLYMEQNEAYELYDIHKSIGVLIFSFILARLAWRIKQGWLKPVREYSKVEQTLSALVHYILLIGSVLIPLTGLMMSIGGGHGLDIFAFNLIPENHSLENPTETLPLNETISSLGAGLHSIISYLLIVALILHIAGALKHHFMDNDATLRRMLGKKIG
jgi:cytochrome b561